MSAAIVDVVEQGRLNEAREARIPWKKDEHLLVTVNYAPNQSQCYVRLPFAGLGNVQWRLEDSIGDASYERDGDDLQTRGLYLDEAAWQAHVLTLTKLDEVRSQERARD